jgi:hypothetical protein
MPGRNPVSREISSSPVQQAAFHLHHLLLRDYRDRWVRYQRERERQGEVHQRAVTEVLKRFVDRNRAQKRYQSVSLDSLPQRVSRALRGDVLSRATLELFIDAFGISENDSRRLRGIHDGTDRIRVLTGLGAIPPDTAAALGPAGHRTTSLHEHHYVGADGLPAWHRTQQVIEATEGRLDRYPYRCDTSALAVEVEEGGRLAGPLYPVGGGLFALDILLDAPLELGAETSLTYVTLFHYAQMPPREMRRVARGAMHNVSMRVEFHPERIPRRVWWAVWDGIDGGIVERDEFELRASRYVFKRLDAVEQSVVGFTWDW